jgi:hypothetical protein
MEYRTYETGTTDVCIIGNAFTIGEVEVMAVR